MKSSRSGNLSFWTSKWLMQKPCAGKKRSECDRRSTDSKRIWTEIVTTRTRYRSTNKTTTNGWIVLIGSSRVSTSRQSSTRSSQLRPTRIGSETRPLLSKTLSFKVNKNTSRRSRMTFPGSRKLFRPKTNRQRVLKWKRHKKTITSDRWVRRSSRKSTQLSRKQTRT